MTFVPDQTLAEWKALNSAAVGQREPFGAKPEPTPQPTRFSPVQIPDSRWAFFRGLARLPDAKPIRGLLSSAGIARYFYANAFLISDLLRRFLV